MSKIRTSPLSPLHTALLEAWDCAFAGSRVTYLSGPITTGIRQIERIRAGALDQIAKRAIIRENSEALRMTAQQLRSERAEIIVEPGSLNIASWSQDEYLELWEQFIERHVRLIVFMPGWEYSIGSAIEYARAATHNIRAESVSGAAITVDDAIALLRTAETDLREDNARGELADLANRLNKVATRLTDITRPPAFVSDKLRKDASLDHLATIGMNVAQFVSFAPHNGRPEQQYSRVAGRAPNDRFASARDAVAELLARSADKSVNVRSYEPFNAQSREFLYGLTSVDEAIAGLKRLTAEGLHTIVNETVDVADGGVSGVLMGNVLEFAPDDTPRCVEKPGTAALPRGWGRELLSAVYRFPVELDVPLASRLEFSLHPRPRGWQQTNILTWEFSEQAPIIAKPQVSWPNRFSRFVGDKVYGLLVAHHIGLLVPYTTVINRRIAPFGFGRRTESGESWIRSAPIEQEPGRFTTRRGWLDPFDLLQSEDPGGSLIASVIAQEGVRPEYSGALIVGATGELIIEGKLGSGESLMIGTALPEKVPLGVQKSIRRTYERAYAVLGPVRFEWVYDGTQCWIVQLHCGTTNTDAYWLVPGAAERWSHFDVADGLSALRSRLASLDPYSGLILRGRIGLTSHMAELIRKAGVPARIES
jgi:hypothetical protein